MTRARAYFADTHRRRRVAVVVLVVFIGALLIIDAALIGRIMSDDDATCSGSCAPMSSAPSTGRTPVDV